jgi:hypothetical protein
VRPYFYGDFYSLQPYSLDADVWTVWQWDRPESKDGVVIVLRRPKSAAVQMELDLQHLKLNKSYHVEIRRTYERAPIKEMKGNELAHLQIHLTDAPGSVVVFYRQK